MAALSNQISLRGEGSTELQVWDDADAEFRLDQVIRDGNHFTTSDLIFFYTDDEADAFLI